MKRARPDSDAPPPEQPGSEQPFEYGERYYLHCVPGIPYTETAHEGHWPKFFRSIAELIVREIAPGTVLDAGCAKGFLVGALTDLGVRAYGVDISRHAIASVRPALAAVCKVGSLAAAESYDFQPRYDLVTCFEVLEHMAEDEAIAAIGQICAHAGMVLFSSTDADFHEPSHVNVWPRLYWIRAFHKHDFLPVFSCGIGQIVPHALLFCRRSQFPQDRELGFLDAAFRSAGPLRDELLQEQKALLARKEEESRRLQQLLLATESTRDDLKKAFEQLEREHRDLVLRASALASRLARDDDSSRRRSGGPRTVAELPAGLAQLRDDSLVLGVTRPGDRLRWSTDLQPGSPRRYALDAEMRRLKGLLFAVDVEIPRAPGHLALQIVDGSGSVAARATVDLGSLERDQPARFAFPAVDIPAQRGWTASLQAVNAACPVRVLELGRSRLRGKAAPLCAFVVD